LRRVVEKSFKGVVIRLVKDSRIYMPSMATSLIAKNLPNLNGLDVLDLGTGSGVLAILASKLGARRVIGIDISRRAIRTAERNAAMNNACVKFRVGDLYEPVKDEVFDLIICNPPMTPSKHPLPRFTWGGVDGRAVLDRAICEAPRHLKDRGTLLVPVVSLVGIGRTWRLFREVGLKPEVIDYSIHPFGDTLLGLIDHLRNLPEADYIYDSFGRPCWRIVLFKAVKP